MKTLQKTAGTLDSIFKITSVLLSVGTVTCLVGLGIIAVGFLLDLDPSLIGTGYDNLSLGPVKLSIAEGFAPDVHHVLLVIAVQITLALVCLLIARKCVACVRDILKPMTLGEPFRTGVGINLKKLAKYSIFLGIAVNAIGLAELGMMTFALDLPALLIGEKITGVTVNFSLDLTFLIVAAVLLLLSYIFRYGEALQQLSDETV